jgi:hypothetical protein
VEKIGSTRSPVTLPRYQPKQHPTRDLIGRKKDKMCMKASCSTCSKPPISYHYTLFWTEEADRLLDKASWVGCGQHIPSVMDKVPEADRCTVGRLPSRPPTPPSPSFANQNWVHSASLRLSSRERSILQRQAACWVVLAASLAGELPRSLLRTRKRTCEMISMGRTGRCGAS